MPGFGAKYRYVVGKGSNKKPVHILDSAGKTYCRAIENASFAARSEFSSILPEGKRLCANCSDLYARDLSHKQAEQAMSGLNPMGYALKVQFIGGSSKLYEYHLPGEVHLELKYLKDYINSGNCRAVVDARGEPKVVRVIDAVNYQDRMYDGDLKPIIVLFDGAVLWEKPEEPYRPKQTSEQVFDPNMGDLDDEIPF